MKRILLCGLKYEKNFGDTIINKCTKYLVQDILKKNEEEFIIEEIDLSGRENVNQLYSIKNTPVKLIKSVVFFILKIIRKIAKKTQIDKIYNYIDAIIWNYTIESQIYNKYFKDKVKECDIIIFAGGGLIKYKYQYFYQYINKISKYADEYGKSIYFNAVGVEGYDEKNYKCRILKKALNRKCVRAITTRDDLENLKNYISDENKIGKVCDPAVYTNKVYGIEKDESANTIGLCVCRKGLFEDNGINYSENDLLKLWSNIIKELEKRNYDWVIYTNGLEGDNEFAYKLVNSMNITNQNKLMIPKTDEELVKYLSKFKAVIATRLHSCIVSYSLGVPAIGLVWNDKLKMFGESIGYPERFLYKDEFDIENIIKRLECAMKQKYENTPSDFKNSVYVYLENKLTKI